MRKLNGTEMKALFVLSIVVPVGLLATFRLTGLLAEPPKLEPLFVEAVEWQTDRPMLMVDIKESVENSYSDGNVSVFFKVFIDDYNANAGVFGGSATTDMNVTATANVSDGFVESMRVVFQEDFKPSEIWIPNHPDEIRGKFQLKNLSVNDLAGRGWQEQKLENNTKGFVTFASVNKPTNVYFNFPVDWALRSGSEQNHRLETVLELVCRTKHSYMKVVVPIIVELTPDVGETFDEAKNIVAGEYQACLDVFDRTDVYSIEVQGGQTVFIALTPPEDANYDVYVYDSDQVEVANSTKPENAQETISFHVNTTGTLYIKVDLEPWADHESQGIYLLTLNM